MSDESAVPGDYAKFIEKKHFSESIVLRRGVLEKFLIDIGDYKGPFHKTMWLQHSTFVRKLKEVGVVMHRSKRDGKYYIDEKRICEPVLFNIDMLDVVKEVEVIAADETGLLEVGGELHKAVNLE